MRLSVFIANKLSTQLIIDLQKIYADYLPSTDLTEQAITEQLQQTSSRLFVTMFNDRHIGAVKVTVTDNQATLSQLTIRDLTRRRGVGKNLLTQIQKILSTENITHIQYDLIEVTQTERSATQAFLSNSGYTIENNIAIKSI